MNDLIKDILNWERFYLSGRLQKPVSVCVVIYFGLFPLGLAPVKVFMMCKNILVGPYTT